MSTSASSGQYRTFLPSRSSVARGGGGGGEEGVGEAKVTLMSRLCLEVGGQQRVEVVRRQEAGNWAQAREEASCRGRGGRALKGLCSGH